MVIRNEKTKLIFLMVIAYMVFLIGVANSYPMHTTTDELGGLVGAAKMAGLDWSGVISNSGYYGFGWYSLFFWLFKITDSPFIIYRTITILTIMLRVLIIPIAYYILKNYFFLSQSMYIYLISFLMPFLHTESVGTIANEDTYGILIWIIIFLVCKASSSTIMKKQVQFAVLILLCSFYSLFMHTRALTFIIALLIVYTFYYAVTRNNYAIIIIIGLPITYILSKKIVTIYQSSIYEAIGNEIRNGSVVISHNFSLLDKNTWDIWFHMIIGMLNTENIITGGLFILSVIVAICYILRIAKNKNNMLSLQANIVLAITILCIGATIAAFLVSGWFEGMLTTWGYEEASSQYSYKGLSYVRYWNIYVPPFMLLALGILPHLNYKKIMNISLVLMVVLHIIYIVKLIPLVKANGNCAYFLYGVGHYRDDFQVSDEYYYKCIAISLCTSLAAFWVIRFKNYKYSIFIVTIFMISFHINVQTEYDMSIKERISSKILASYNAKCELEASNIKIGTIYLNDETPGNDANWKIYSVAQFYFNKYTLQIELPEKLRENDIIISTNPSNYIENLYDNIQCYILDSNEVWYTYLNLETLKNF